MCNNSQQVTPPRDSGAPGKTDVQQQQLATPSLVVAPPIGFRFNGDILHPALLGEILDQMALALLASICRCVYEGMHRGRTVYRVQTPCVCVSVCVLPTTVSR